MEDINNSNKDYWLNLILESFINERKDAENSSELEEWLAKSEDNRLYYEEFLKIWEASGIIGQENTFDDSKAYTAFKSRREKKQRQTRLRYLRYAAVVIPFVILSYFSWMYLNGQNETPVSAVSNIVVGKGSKTKLELADGTKIWLNAGSELQVDEHFTSGKRLINLVGEAYLEVAKNEKSPFYIETTDVTVKVLGTKFNVNAYRENDKISVSLLEGAVEVISGKLKENSKMLKPNEVLRYEKTTEEVDIESEGVAELITWMRDGLIFDTETFEQIAYTLERHFNVKIQINKEGLKNRRFSGDFVNNETLDKIFSVMSSEGDFKYKIKGNVIEVN